MKFAGFVFFSALEYMAFAFFILVLFRFSLKENIYKFAIFAIVLSFVSNTLQTESLRAISPLVQASLMILFVGFVLRIHIFSATLMVITGYVINFIVSGIIASITLHIGVVTEILPYTRNAYIMQTASAFMMVMFGGVTYLQNGGFSFIDNRSRLNTKKIFSQENRPFVVFLILSFVSIFAANLLNIIMKDPPYLLVSIVLIVALLGLLYLTVKRDEKSE